MLEQIGLSALNGFLWALDRCARILTTIAFVWIADWLFPFPEKDQILLSDATVSDLASAMIIPCLVVMFFYMALKGDR